MMLEKTALFDYPEGLLFECTRCAVCCMDTEAHVRHILLLEQEAERISRVVLQPVGNFAFEIKGREPYTYEMRKTLEGGRCVFLDEKSCRVYAFRPLVCRFYPFELRADRDEKHIFSVTDECVGLGKGEPLRKKVFEGLFHEARGQLDNP